MEYVNITNNGYQYILMCAYLIRRPSVLTMKSHFHMGQLNKVHASSIILPFCPYRDVCLSSGACHVYSYLCAFCVYFFSIPVSMYTSYTYCQVFLHPINTESFAERFYTTFNKFKLQTNTITMRLTSKC